MLLVLDTSTRRSLVACGDAAGIRGRSELEVGHHHGTHLLEQVEAALAAAGIERDAIDAIAVGTGPGSFTGLRVGLATAKTLAYVRGVPLAGVSSTDALARAAAMVLMGQRGSRPAASADPSAVAVVLPAGAHDHYLALPGREVELVPPGGLAPAIPSGLRVAAVDVGPEVLGTEAVALGRAALEGLADALMAAAWERHARGEQDDPATLVPRYVALPRGLSPAAAGSAWSPDLR